MATRTATRPAARPRPAPRRSASYGSRPASGRRGGSVSSRRRRPAARRRRRPGLPIRLGRALVRLVAGLWILLALLAGKAARAIGSGARDIDQTHRRDGAGLAALAAAVVTAAAIWGGGAGPVGSVVIAIVRGALGQAAFVVPIMCVLAAWHLLRHEPEEGMGSRL